MEAANPLHAARRAEQNRKYRERYARDILLREERNWRRRKAYNEMDEDKRKEMQMKSRLQRQQRLTRQNVSCKTESGASSSASSGTGHLLPNGARRMSLPGVITSVPKKILCYDKGIVRWPNPKVQFLSQRSTKNHSPKEKQEQHAELPKAAGEKHKLAANYTVSSSLGSQLQNKNNISSAQEMSRVAAASQQQGSKNANPNQNPNHKSDPKSLSFNEVSRLFSLPLSDAADTLGVCSSVLKKICYENGLVRWPYRKFLRGKSIEEMKEDAAREKQEQHAELPKAAGGNPELGSLLLNNNSGSAQEMLKSAAASQRQGSTYPQTWISRHMCSSYLPNGTTSSSDEFKYGFQVDGLSVLSYKWWGSRSADGDKVTKKDKENADASKQQSEGPMEKHECKTDKSNVDSFGAGLLSDLRKQAAKEGEEALRLGVYQGHSLFKLDSTKRKRFFEYLSHHIQVWRQEWHCNKNPLKLTNMVALQQESSEDCLELKP